MHWPGVWWATYRGNECTGLGRGAATYRVNECTGLGRGATTYRVNECTGLGHGGPLTESMSALAWGVVGHLPSQ